MEFWLSQPVSRAFLSPLIFLSVEILLQLSLQRLSAGPGFQLQQATSYLILGITSQLIESIRPTIWWDLPLQKYQGARTTRWSSFYDFFHARKSDALEGITSSSACWSARESTMSRSNLGVGSATSSSSSSSASSSPSQSGSSGLVALLLRQQDQCDQILATAQAMSIEPVIAVMVVMVPHNFGSCYSFMTSCDLKVLENHAKKGSVTQHYRSSFVPELGLAQQRERRSEQPISPQAKLCLSSNLTLRTWTGKSRNLCGLTVSGFGTLLSQTASKHLDCWRFVLEVELPPFELQRQLLQRFILLNAWLVKLLGNSHKLLNLLAGLRVNLSWQPLKMIGSAFGLIKKSLGFTYHSTILNRINTHRNSLGSIIMEMQFLVVNLTSNINRALTPVGWRRTSALGSFWQGLHDWGYRPSPRPAALDRFLTGTIAIWGIGRTISRPHWCDFTHTTLNSVRAQIQAWWCWVWSGHISNMEVGKYGYKSKIWILLRWR